MKEDFDRLHGVIHIVNIQLAHTISFQINTSESNIRYDIDTFTNHATRELEMSNNPIKSIRDEGVKIINSVLEDQLHRYLLLGLIEWVIHVAMFRIKLKKGKTPEEILESTINNLFCREIENGKDPEIVEFVLDSVRERLKKEMQNEFQRELAKRLVCLKVIARDCKEQNEELLAEEREIEPMKKEAYATVKDPKKIKRILELEKEIKEKRKRLTAERQGIYKAIHSTKGSLEGSLEADRIDKEEECWKREVYKKREKLKVPQLSLLG